MKSALMFSKASDEWATPQAFFDALDAEFDFALDAAASVTNAKCYRWLSDSLGADWLVISGGHPIWLNCPYSRCAEFIQTAALEAFRGATVVALVPSRTDTRWWHAHVWDAEKHHPRPGVEIRFVKGRLKFGDGKNSAPFPSVVIVFRPPQQDGADAR